MNRYQSLLWILLCIFTSEIGISQNLVPNPSFEETHGYIRENKNNAYIYEPRTGYQPFLFNLGHWKSGNINTPDLRILSPKHYDICTTKYKDCDYPHSGSKSVGIITYMKNRDTETYREYMVVKLKKPLRPNVETYIEFWTSKERDAKLISNNLGCYFSKKAIYADIQENLEVTPQFNHKTLINKQKNQWVKIEGTFTPEEAFEFLTIGNFYSNQETQFEKCNHFTSYGSIHPYAYYFIDDVRVWQKGDVPETKPIPQKEHLVFNQVEVHSNEPIILENIGFEFDQATLLAASQNELNELHRLLVQHPNLQITIHGHTDNQGDEFYNLNLSQDRAQAVFNYLNLKGIAANRMQYQGFGEQKPIASNADALGRSKNRRVEFIVR